MQRYNKLWALIVGAAVEAALVFGFGVPPESTVTWLVQAGTIFTAWAVPNRS